MDGHTPFSTIMQYCTPILPVLFELVDSDLWKRILIFRLPSCEVGLVSSVCLTSATIASTSLQLSHFQDENFIWRDETNPLSQDSLWFLSVTKLIFFSYYQSKTHTYQRRRRREEKKNRQTHVVTFRMRSGISSLILSKITNRDELTRTRRRNGNVTEHWRRTDTIEARQTKTRCKKEKKD